MANGPSPCSSGISKTRSPLSARHIPWNLNKTPWESLGGRRRNQPSSVCMWRDWGLRWSVRRLLASTLDAVVDEKARAVSLVAVAVLQCSRTQQPLRNLAGPERISDHLLSAFPRSGSKSSFTSSPPKSYTRDSPSCSRSASGFVSNLPEPASESEPEPVLGGADAEAPEPALYPVQSSVWREIEYAHHS